MNFNGHVFTTKAVHLVGGTRLWSGMERVGHRHATSALDMPHEYEHRSKTHTGSAVARVTKGRAHHSDQDGGGKFATGQTTDTING